MAANTIIELEASLGERLRALRLNEDIDQKTLAAQAGISLGALKNLEAGNGSTLRSLIAVLRALRREEWLNVVAPIATINPLHRTRKTLQRVRASRKASTEHAAPTTNSTSPG